MSPDPSVQHMALATSQTEMQFQDPESMSSDFEHVNNKTPVTGNDV